MIITSGEPSRSWSVNPRPRRSPIRIAARYPGETIRRDELIAEAISYGRPSGTSPLVPPPSSGPTDARPDAVFAASAGASDLDNAAEVHDGDAVA